MARSVRGIRFVGGVVGVLPVLLACGSNPPEDAPPSVTVADSAGVRLVTLPVPLSVVSQPELEVEQVGRIGDTGSAVELFRVTSARFLPSGALAIGNSGSAEVVVVALGGEVLQRLGGRGEGPGEFGAVTSLHLDSAGRLIVFDDGQARLTLFDQGGEVIDTRRLTDPSSVADLIPLSVRFDGPVLAVYGDNRTFGAGGVRQDTTPLLQFTPESAVPDTIGLWATRAWHFIRLAQGVTRSPLAFGPDLLHSGRDGRAALAETHTAEAVMYSGEGLLQVVVRWSERPRAVADAEYEAWRREREEGMRDLPDEIREALAATPSFGRHAVIAGLFLGVGGEIWLAPTSLHHDGTQTWIRISERGEPLGSVELPSDATLLDAWNGRLAVLRKDSLDIEMIEVYEFSGAS